MFSLSICLLSEFLVNQGPRTSNFWGLQFMIAITNQISLVSCLFLAAASSSVFAEDLPKKKGYFVSVDGSNPDLIDILLEKDVLNAPFGFKWLHTKSAVFEKAMPGEISITAPSHVSTITCSPPSRHGIVGNGFYVNGAKVNGFSYEFKTEPLWISAKRDRKIVMSLAYVGADASTERRTADYSLAYPNDTLMGQTQLLDLDLSTLAVASNWNTNGADRSLPVLKETTVTILVNPKTKESKIVNLLFAGNADLSATTLYIDDDKDLSNGMFGSLFVQDAVKPIVNAYFTEQHADSELWGYTRRAFFRIAKAEGAKLSLYISRASYNNAFPESFRKSLEKDKLVWPDYGFKIERLTPEEYVDSQAMIDRFLTDVAVRYQKKLNIDVLLFYQPLVDSVGHKLQSALPMPFDPAATDDVTRTFVRAYKVIDENLSKIFSKANRSKDVFAVMGDHGMDPVVKAVNFARFLPADHLQNSLIYASGSLMLVYPNPEGPGSPEERIAAARLVGAKAKESLLAANFEGRPVLELAVEQGVGNVAPGTAADYRQEWQYGDAVWAFSTQSGFWFQYKPLDQVIYSAPAALGMHGQSLKIGNMATRMIFKGPGVKPVRVPTGSLLDAVPTFTHLMGMQKPADCVGQIALPGSSY
jgi:predicted AlkP superfamily pyrophosphatase or phosphodiesterase